ncbi:MAG: hypothetical protein KAX38_09460, partial [Candidatus Krumholzibacteria bacterium]|nr:hypothetical protein [Candidatus Krumholzibacteria bacterium]
MNIPIDRLIFEERAESDPLTQRLISKLPDARTEKVKSAREVLKTDPGRSNSIVLMHHPGAFVKSFPVTPGSP